MQTAKNLIEEARHDFDVTRLDVSDLVGRKIKLFSHQLPGKEITSKVLAVADGQMQVDSGPRFNTVENLVSHQTVVVQFPHRGEEISVKAQLKRTVGGRLYLVLGDKASPLSQRRFMRRPLTKRVRLATYPIVSSHATELSHLRWMETTTVDISSGGALLEVSSALEPSVYLLLNIDLNPLEFPPLVLGVVRHRYQSDDACFRVGVEFIVKEAARRMFSSVKRGTLPPSLFAYTRAYRQQLNSAISQLNLTNEDAYDRSTL